MRLDTNNIKERISGSFIELLGIELVETEDINTIEARLKVTNKLIQSTGVLHGGVTITLAETVAGIGSNVVCQSDEYSLGMQISASHISSGQVGDILRAKGRLIHKGRTTHLWNVDVISEITGKLISTVRITNSVIKRK